MTEERADRDKDKEKRARTKPFTKLVLRRLPPTMTEDQFLDHVSPIPEHDYFYFAKPDPSLNHCGFSRAHINFINVEDVYLFKEKFDGYIFLDEKGVEYYCIVEYSPFQRIPKKRKKKDPKCGTIESDPLYQEFLECLKEPENENREPKLEYSYQVNDSHEKKSTITPLLEFLAARKQDKRGREERRRRETDKRKIRIDRKSKEASIKNSKNVSGQDCTNSPQGGNGKTYQRNASYHAENKSVHKFKVVHKDIKVLSKTESEMEMTALNWDSHFPALCTRTHNTFTLTSCAGVVTDSQESREAILRSGGDTCFEEEESPDNEVKKIKSRDWEKDKISPKKKEEDFEVHDSKASVKPGSKSYREQRKQAEECRKRTEEDKREFRNKDENDKSFRKDRRERKDAQREQKPKESRYCESRKDKSRKEETSDKSESKKSEEKKAKSLSHSDIKPFTQLPQVKTEDLTKVIDEMDRKLKLEGAIEAKSKEKLSKTKDRSEEASAKAAKVKSNRRNSLDSNASSMKEEPQLKRQNSMEDRCKSTDREDSEEKDNNGLDTRKERRIRNKDRPSLQIYQPGMGKFSKQRITKDKDSPQISTGKTDVEPEKKDT